LTVEFRILGPLEVVRDGSPVALGGPRQRALLALLLTRAGAVVPRDRLIDEIWDGDAPPSAVNVLQTYASHLRKALPPGRLVSRPPGYALEAEADEIDLHRFERLVEEGRRSLADGDAETASQRLSQALGLWRGPALADVAESIALRVEAGRLEELRFAALEARFEADLALGRHAQIVGELEAFVAEQPLRERPRAQLMLALYGSGRQSEALAVYRDARAALVEELGIEPGQALREVHAAVLRQDPSLEAPGVATSSLPLTRSLLVACSDELNLEVLLGVVEPLARHPGHELVLVMLASDREDLPRAARTANGHRASLAERGLTVRAAAFTSGEPAPDLMRLVRDADTALLVADAVARLDAEGRFDAQLSALLAGVPCDVALLAGRSLDSAPEARAPVLVPFGGAEHEWAAVELGAWIAGTENRPLRLAGVEADPVAGRRDASRLLATATLLVQQVTGVETEPVLIAAGPDELSTVAGEARVLLLGLPDDWSSRGLGSTRATIVERAACPLLLVRGGPKPGVLAPSDSLTRFAWTISAGTR
jgi:DNA-binding SARP family transcriptional activator